MPKLLINAGTHHALEVQLKPGANHLGRGDTNDLIFEDASVSSLHAQIYVNGSSVRIKDLGSTNGTFINHETVAEAVLKSGQVLRLGGVEMIYQEELPANVLPPPLARLLETTTASPSFPPRPAKNAAPPPTVPPTMEIGVTVVQPSPIPSQKLAASASLDKLTTEPPPALATSVPSPAIEIGVAAIAPRIPQPSLAHSTTTLAAIPTPDQAAPVPPSASPRDKSAHRRLARGIDFYRPPPAVHEGRPAPKLPPAESPRVSSTPPQALEGRSPGAFSYPFRAGTGVVVISLAICLAGADFLAGFFPVAAILIKLLIAGFVLVLLQKLVRHAAQGYDSEPPLPEMANPREELLPSAMQTLGTVFVCFGPAIALGLLSQTRGPGFASFGIFPVTVLGCLYFPMAFLMVTMFDTLAAINPAQVLTALLKVPGPCLGVSMILGLALAVFWIGNVLTPTLIAIPNLPQVLCRLLGLYLLTVAGRKLGLVYFTNHRRLAWFSRGAAVEGS